MAARPYAVVEISPLFPSAVVRFGGALHTSRFGGHKAFNSYESVPEIRQLTILPEGCCDCKKLFLEFFAPHTFDSTGVTRASAIVFVGVTQLPNTQCDLIHDCI
jgi:hypothetical protein